MKLLKCLGNVFLNIWGAFPILYMYCVGSDSHNRLFYLDLILQLRIFDNVGRCFRNLGYDYTDSTKVFCTEFFLLMIFTAISVFFLLMLFTLMPVAVRLLSHILLFAITLQKIQPWDGNLSDVEVVLLVCCTVYTAVGIYRTFRQIQSMEALGDMIVGAGKRRSSPVFYISVVFVIIGISCALLMIRLIDFNSTSLPYTLCYYYFLIANVFIIKYCLRCVYGLFFFRSSVPCYRNIELVELIPLFFASCLAGILKPINIVGAIIHKYLVLLRFDPDNNIFLKLLENNRTKLYYAIIHNTSYFVASIKSRHSMWHGELKSKLNSIQFTEPLFPLIILSCYTFVACFAKVVDCFRIEDMIMIQFIFYYSAMELFYTFSVVEIINPYLSAPPEICTSVETMQGGYKSND